MKNMPWHQLANLNKYYIVLMVSKFQNEFMKLSFLLKYEQKIVRISALTTQGRNPDNFLFVVCISGETITSLIHSEIV